jgi:hypothetical protein
MKPERETNHQNLQLTQVPLTKTGMLIQKPVAEVFEAASKLDTTQSE